MISLNNCKNILKCSTKKTITTSIFLKQYQPKNNGLFLFYSTNNNNNNNNKNKNNNKDNESSTINSRKGLEFDFKKTEDLVKKSFSGKEIHEIQTQKPQQNQQQNNEQQQQQQKDTKDDKSTADQSLTKRLSRNALSFLVFGFFSFGIAVYLASHDDTEFYIKNIDSTMKKLKTITDYELLTSRLSVLAELSSKNTTLKKLFAKEEYINQLLDNILDYSDLEINNKSAKIIENASEFITDYSIIPKLLEVAQLKYIPSYVKKTLASAISKIAIKGDDEARLKLASNGAIEFLNSMMSLKQFKSQLFKSALLSICSTCDSIPTTITLSNLDGSSVSNRNQLIEKYSNEEKQIKDDLLELKKRELIQSGYHLYLHTSAGGFAWGCFESIRKKLPLKMILLNGCKNSIITAALPIVFVGLMTTYANNTLKTLDTTKEKMGFYFAGIYSLFPWYYILPTIEKFSPYWIGGHVLGFMSFFTYLAYSEYDIFKSDTILIEKDRLLPPRNVLIENLNKSDK